MHNNQVHAMVPVENVETPKESKLTENHHQIRQAAVPVAKVSRVERKKSKSLLSRIIPRFGYIFGLDFGDNSKRSFIHKLIVFVICFIIWIINWVALKFVLGKNWACYTNTSIFKKLQCTDIYLVANNTIDAFFGISCALHLFLNRCTIARMFSEMIEPLDQVEANKHENVDAEMAKANLTARRKISVLSGFMVLLCLVLPVLVVVTNNAGDYLKILLSGNKMEEGFYMACNVPLSTLSIYFCMMYAMVCFIIKQHYNILTGKAQTLKYPEFNQRYTRFQGMVNLAESSFNQFLPVIYFLRLLTLMTWINYTIEEISPDYDIFPFPRLRCPQLVYHVLQILLLLGPPIYINSLLSMPIPGPVVFEGRKHPLGVYTPDFDKDKRSHKSQLLSRHCYLTSGGVRISTWFIPLMITFAFLLTTVHDKLEAFEEKIDDMIRRHISRIPKPSPPMPCPSLSCPTCPSLNCFPDNGTKSN